MKKIILLTFITIATGIVSCNSDDDLSGQIQPITLNQFCYGPDTADTFNVETAYNRPTTLVSTDVYSTEVTVVDENIMQDMTGELQGVGNLLSFTFVGNADIAIQSGIYRIDTAQNSGNVTVSYSLNFDSSMQLNSGVAIVSGLVRVTPNGPGFIIEVDGLDANDVRFHGNYVGRLTPFN
jgi:hypothetical protein